MRLSHVGLIVTSHNVFDAPGPDDATYRELAKVALKSPGRDNNFKGIQKTGSKNTRKNPRFLSVADFVETSKRKRGTGSQLCKLWYPPLAELVAMMRALLYDDPTINRDLASGWILHVAPLHHVQGAHQDGKLQAKRIATSSARKNSWEYPSKTFIGQHSVLLPGPGPTVTDNSLELLWVTIPPNSPRIRYVMGPSRSCLPTHGMKGMSTPRLHLRSRFSSTRPASQPGPGADSNRQLDSERYFDVNGRQTSEDDRQAIVANAASPHLVELEL